MGFQSMAGHATDVLIFLAIWQYHSVLSTKDRMQFDDCAQSSCQVSRYSGLVEGALRILNKSEHGPQSIVCAHNQQTSGWQRFHAVALGNPAADCTTQDVQKE